MAETNSGPLPFKVDALHEPTALYSPDLISVITNTHLHEVNRHLVIYCEKDINTFFKKRFTYVCNSRSDFTSAFIIHVHSGDRSVSIMGSGGISF